MDIKKQEVKDLFVTLNTEDGSTIECKVMASFEVGANTYAALLPMDENGNVNMLGQIMLYRLEEDETHNPIVVYIENDVEYNLAATEFSKLLNQ